MTLLIMLVFKGGLNNKKNNNKGDDDHDVDDDKGDDDHDKGDDDHDDDSFILRDIVILLSVTAFTSSSKNLYHHNIFTLAFII